MRQKIDAKTCIMNSHKKTYHMCLNRPKTILTILTLVAFLMPVHLLSQQSDAGNWLMYFGQNRFSDKLSLHTEVQYRNHTVAPNNTEQLLLRTGVNYHLKSAMITGGYGYIGSHVYLSDQTAPEVVEHRIWQQLITTNQIGRLKLEHRYRVEQRWVNDVYKNRLRYRLMAFLPLNKKTIEKGTVFLGVYDEIFMNTEQNYFDRNRLYGAVGYQINQLTGVQVGMLHQETNTGGKHYLQFALVFNTDFRSAE